MLKRLTRAITRTPRGGPVGGWLYCLSAKVEVPAHAELDVGTDFLGSLGYGLSASLEGW